MKNPTKTPWGFSQNPPPPGFFKLNSPPPWGMGVGTPWGPRGVWGWGPNPSENLYSIYLTSATLNFSVSVMIKILWFCACFPVFSNLATTHVISLGFFFIKFKNGMSQTKYKKIALWIGTAGIWQLITKHGYWHDIFCRWVVWLQRWRYAVTSG